MYRLAQGFRSIPVSAVNTLRRRAQTDLLGDIS